MSQPYGASGTKIYVSTAVLAEPADAAAYNALSWTEVGDVRSVGDYGDEAQILTESTLQDSRIFKSKGPRDAGTLAITVLDRPDDSGQVAMIAAEATPYSYPFKIVLPNRLTVGGTDGIEYFIGLVTSKRLNVADTGNIVKRTFNVAINSKITPVAAT
jgi:hypothetical protein